MRWRWSSRQVIHSQDLRMQENAASQHNKTFGAFDSSSDGPFVDNHRQVEGGELPVEVETGAAKHRRESGELEDHFEEQGEMVVL